LTNGLAYAKILLSNQTGIKKMLKDGLYHKEVYMPEVEIISSIEQVNYTLHALDAAESDPYDVIILKNEYDFSKSDTIEIEVKDNEVIKLVSRFDYNNEYDLIVVIVPQNKNVKTLWLNEKNDTHLTLDTSKYNKNEF